MTENSFISSLLEKLGQFVPNAIAALIILVVGLILAGVIRKGAAFLLGKLKIDERINKGKEAETALKVEGPITIFTYYLALLYVLLLVLSILGVNDVLAPLSNMFDTFVGYIPNIIASVVIGFAGFIIARIVASLVGAAAKGVDVVSSKIGLTDSINLPKLAY
jgi:glucose-6-phosphate-specific signal transduction histidine kinase